jgi:flagellin FlaB
MSRENRYLNENESGAIGIGAMIIFIALILVAAVASTIIIKTAEELQQRAEATGDDTRDEISGKIQLVGAYISDDNAA